MHCLLVVIHQMACSFPVIWGLWPMYCLLVAVGSPDTCSFPVMPISSSWLWREFRKLWPKPLSSMPTWTVWSLSASVLSHAWLKLVRSSTNTSTVLLLIGIGMTFLAHLTFILIGTLQEVDDFYKFYSLIWQLVKAQRNFFQKENS